MNKLREITDYRATLAEAKDEVTRLKGLLRKAEDDTRFRFAQGPQYSAKARVEIWSKHRERTKPLRDDLKRALNIVRRLREKKNKDRKMAQEKPRGLGYYTRFLWPM